MRFPRRLPLTLVLAAAILPAFAQSGAPVPAAKPAAGKADSKPESQVPLEEIRRYVTVYNTVKQAYVEPVDDRKLMQSAIRGLLLDLDPHSAYLVRSDAQSLEEDSSGAYDGIGVDVQVQPDGTILVIAPIDDTPAARAGVKPGDLIVAIDGKPLTPDSLGENPLRGEPGSSTVLTVQREGQAKPIDITVKRETIRISSVRGRMLEPGYGYLRISTFQADTANDFVRQLDELSAQAADKRLRGLVLDLRSNPGGLLTAAVQIADELLDKGGIVSTRGRNPVVDTVFNATSGDRLQGTPVVVLVDAGSASASEVLAAALRDNGRARVVGSRTFGKGSVQTVLPLDNGDAVKLTTARYYTPSGRSIQARGIEPDVVLKPEGARSAGSYSESALPGHLRGEQETAGQGVGDVLDGEGPITAALGVLKTQGNKPLAASAKP
ncbi:S41 family peptidase [Lysobacter brunescens]|uniref:S41 family peptidase n=1 Tax=Lysobacter brunescens TaxID=262323 RepID=A0ABW2YCD4_9GAMM